MFLSPKLRRIHDLTYQRNTTNYLISMYAVQFQVFDSKVLRVS